MESSEPDSTTMEKDMKEEDFVVGKDVLFHKDGCFYLGTIVQVDPICKRCLLKFMDNTQTWSYFKDLKPFQLEEESDVTCVACKKSQTKTDKDMIVCKCGRGYHKTCHQPPVPADHGPDWTCKRCTPKKEEKQENRIMSTFIGQQAPPTTVSQLPYNPDNLTWDSQHKVNQENQYCYCGSKGNWYSGMLQCRRCRQWFHAKCTQTVTWPVFSGDLFYVFVCSLCNQGKEYSRRLALKWTDLIHLVLYNLTFLYQTKYYDFENAILPYINKHWIDFKLPPSMSSATEEERKHHILNALLACEKKFKCGREIKKRNNIWGLRIRGPPKSPQLSLPTRGPIDDNILRLYCKKHLIVSELEFKPLQNGYINSSEHCRATRTEEKIVPQITDPKLPSTRSQDPSKESKINASTEYHGRGLVKRSTPFPSTEPSANLDSRFRTDAIKRAKNLLIKKTKSKTGRTKITKTENLDFSQKFKEFVEEQTRQKKKEILETPGIRKRPQRNLLEARLNSTESKLYNGNIVVEETDKKKDKENKTKLTNSKKRTRLVQTTIIDSFNKNKLRMIPYVNVEKYRVGDYLKRKRYDTDSSEEDTSSKGTLDLIPVPKDFEGRNNPFRNITLPLPLKTVIEPVKLKKRQLSEKDIRIDRNGQIKRRRRHYRASKPPQILPVSDYQNGEFSRQLRNREVQQPSIPVTKSPVKESTTHDDYESSVKYFFGASSRIASGEKFEVKAKRVLDDGRTQCIIEWM